MDPLKHLRSELERNILRAWEHLTEGWRELLSRSSAALTHFASSAENRPEAEAARNLPSWSLLSAEVWETARSVIIRVETATGAEQIPESTRCRFDVPPEVGVRKCESGR